MKDAKKKKGKSLKYITIIIFALICCLIGFGKNESTVYNEILHPSEATILSEQQMESESLVATTQETTAVTITVSEEMDESQSSTYTIETTTKFQPTQSYDLPADSTFSVTFIDVGQADAALVECDGHYMLIDGGNKGDSNIIYSVLKRKDVSHLDIVVGTHAHEDHIGGLPGAFNYATASLTLCPVQLYDSQAFKDFAKYANQKGNGIVVPSVGDQHMLGSALITIVGVNSNYETNNTSIVLKIQYGKTSFLFTGDAEREAEQVVLNNGFDISATVLKVGHHGSDTSTSYLFLREIMPQYAVISVGKGNSYGHPTDDTLSRLRDADVNVFRTDINGDIIFISDGEKVSVSTDKQISSNDKTTTKVSEKEPMDRTEVVNESVDEAKGNKKDYIINKNTEKFHYTYCSSVKQMKESNKRFYTGFRDDLVAEGYSPCGNCHP